MSQETAVALFIYNRPLQTARVFTRLAEVRPKRLFLIADGPSDELDALPCDAARSAVNDVSWDCQVSRNYSDVHMGNRRRVTSGIDWVFSRAERAIFLEDDCLPDPTFIPYCDEMLASYADDEHVMTISGDNFQFGVEHSPYSYYFSAVHHLWGWATWRRAWAHHDAQMRQWRRVAETDFPGEFLPTYAAHYHKRLMGQTYRGELDSWQYSWIFACWLRRGLCALPSVNLVSNIGFGPGATNCKRPDASAALRTQPIEFPLRHPPFERVGTIRRIAA
jgi:hypothetical protein